MAKKGVIVKRKKKPVPAEPVLPQLIDGCKCEDAFRVHLVPIDSVHPDPNNARLHPEKNVGAIMDSLDRYGFQKPMVMRADRTLIAGNGQLEAARLLGWTKVPVTTSSLQGVEAAGYAVADNRTAELARWNEEKLAQSVQIVVATWGEQAGKYLGFDTAEIRAITHPAVESTQDPDDVPAPPDSATTRPGDLVTLGTHRLLCGDSSKPGDVDRLLGGEMVHLVNTDPPYNVNVESRSNNSIAAGTSSFQSKHGATHTKLRAKDRSLINDFISDEAFDVMLGAWFGNMSRVLIPGGGFYIWGGYSNCGNYPPRLKSCGLYFAQAIIWIKEHPVMTRKDFMGNHEWAFYGWKEGAAHRYFGPKNVPDTWRVGLAPGKTGVHLMPGQSIDLVSPNGGHIVLASGQGKAKPIPVTDAVEVIIHNAAFDTWSIKKISPQKMIHLTEKPVELARRAMEYSSKAGENVLDLFGGSGSTLIGAEMTGRRSYLMEMDPLYCDVIIARFEKFSGKKAKVQRA